MRTPRASTWLSILIVILCVPLGALLFPESSRTLKDRITGWVSSVPNRPNAVEVLQEAPPEEVVQVPAAVESVQEPDEPRPIASTNPTQPFDEPEVEPAPMTDAVAAAVVVEEALPAPELDLDWTDTSPIANLPEPLDPDRLPRELTDDVEREVRRGYRSALATLRTARSRK